MRVLLLVVLLALASGGVTAAQQQARCRDYPDQATAQRAYRADPVGLAQLDADRDGIACEDEPCPCDRAPVAPQALPAQPRVPTVAPVAAAAPSAAAAAAPPAASASPLPHPVDIGGGWLLAVAAVNADATAQVQGSGPTSRPLPADAQMVLVTLVGRNLGTAPERFPFARLRVAGPTGMDYSLDANNSRCGGIPSALPDADVAPGGVVLGNVCWLVSRADAAALQLDAGSSSVGDDAPTVALLTPVLRDPAAVHTAAAGGAASTSSPPTARVPAAPAPTGATSPLPGAGSVSAAPQRAPTALPGVPPSGGSAVVIQNSYPVGPVTTGQFPAFPQAAPANPAPIGVPSGPDVVTPTGANVREPNPASLAESQMQIQCLTYGVGCY